MNKRVVLKKAVCFVIIILMIEWATENVQSYKDVQTQYYCFDAGDI